MLVCRPAMKDRMTVGLSNNHQDDYAQKEREQKPDQKKGRGR